MGLGLIVLVVAVPISTPFKYILIAVVSKTPTTWPQVPSGKINFEIVGLLWSLIPSLNLKAIEVLLPTKR